MGSKHYIAFDLGASSGRAVLGIFDGSKIQLEEIHRFPNGNVHAFQEGVGALTARSPLAMVVPVDSLAHVNLLRSIARTRDVNHRGSV